jgi:hypothetical protein
MRNVEFLAPTRCVGAYTATLRVAFVPRSGTGHVPTQSLGTRHIPFPILIIPHLCPLLTRQVSSAA